MQQVYLEDLTSCGISLIVEARPDSLGTKLVTTDGYAARLSVKQTNELIEQLKGIVNDATNLTKQG